MLIVDFLGGRNARCNEFPAVRCSLCQHTFTLKTVIFAELRNKSSVSYSLIMKLSVKS